MNEEGLHPGHRSIRLNSYDYASSGCYFVTICTVERRCLFGSISARRMELNRLGRLVQQAWLAIPAHFVQVKSHEFVVMPNHVHGLIEITCQAGAQYAAPLQSHHLGEGHQGAVRPGSLSAIVRSFKSAVTKQAREMLHWEGEIWQRNYFERVVRDGKELTEASRYIAENPLQWEWDRENVKAGHVAASEANGAQHAAPLQRQSRNDVPWN